LFLLFLFVVAWRAPNPPNPEYGIELNFGLDSQGSGEVQPQNPVGTEQQSEDPKTEVKNDQPEETDEPTPSEVKPSETKPVEKPVTTKQDSPEVVKEEKKQDTKPVEKPVEKKPDPAALYKPNTSSKTSETTQTKTGEQASQGDDTGKTGDKGDPKGPLDAKALYGKQGGGDGGPTLELAGWNWDFVPRPSVPNNETGRVVFEIKVGEDGEIISYRTLERSVSIEAENICKKELEKLTFSKTGTNVPKESTGRITFVIRSN
jgi:outer membrane biosynthesis protein TonB